jgi:hypothetical protein
VAAHAASRSAKKGVRVRASTMRVRRREKCSWSSIGDSRRDDYVGGEGRNGGVAD